MAVAANKALAIRFITQVWNAGDLTVADELIHPDYLVPGGRSGTSGGQVQRAGLS